MDGADSQASPTQSAKVPTSGASGAVSTASSPASRPDVKTVFARLEPELVRCYENGKRSTPTMLDGKLTLNASIDASGRTTCVIPTEDSGLTQEVEDCMSSRFAEQTFEGGGPWSISMPVAVRGGKVQLGSSTSEGLLLESVETYRMPDAFETLETLLPELQVCAREIDRSSGVRTMMVGARVGIDGRTHCTVASAPSGVLAPKVADCAAGVLRHASFPPPKGGPGLVLVPIHLLRK